MKTTLPSLGDEAVGNGQTAHNEPGQNGQRKPNDPGVVKFTPMKASVGLEKQVGLAQAGSLSASCHVDVEFDRALLGNDLAEFKQQVRLAFQACSQVIEEQLALGGHQISATPKAVAAGSANGRKAAGSQQAVDELVSDLLADEDDQRDDGEEELAAKENAPQEKAAPAKSRAKDGSEEEVPRVSAKYWATLAASVLVLCVFWLVTRTPTPLDAADLASIALGSGSVADKSNAVAELGSRGPGVREHLRRIVNDSKDPEIVSLALGFLSGQRDGHVVRLALEKLDDPSPEVRQAAISALAEKKGVAESELGLKADDPAEVRGPVVENLRKEMGPRPGAIILPFPKK